jgi:hypothetical protein
MNSTFFGLRISFLTFSAISILCEGVRGLTRARSSPRGGVIALPIWDTVSTGCTMLGMTSWIIRWKCGWPWSRLPGESAPRWE